MGPECEPWPLDVTCVTGWPENPEQWTPEQRRAAVLAGELLWRATAGAYGVCREQLRPCDPVPARGGGGGRRGGPPPMQLTWRPVEQIMLAVELVARGAQQMTIDAGDGSAPYQAESGEPIMHLYPRAGAYTVTATDATNPARKVATQVGIVDHNPRVVVFSSGDDPWEVLVWIDEAPAPSRYLIDWGDGSVPSPALGMRRQQPPPHPRILHTYDRWGTFPVTVTDIFSRRKVTCHAPVGYIGVIFTYPDRSDPFRPQMNGMWMAVGAGWIADWGDGSPVLTGKVPAAAQVRLVRAEDMAPGQYRVQLSELANGRIRRQAARLLTIPNQWNWDLNVSVAWRKRQDLDAGMQDVYIQVSGARAWVVIDWGDGSPLEELPGNGNTWHKYAVPPPAEGYRMTVTEEHIADPRTFTRLITIPRDIGIPILSARGARAVDLYIAGADDERNDDWYQVDWGDGTIDPLAAVGRWFPAHHTYVEDGVYTITVDAPGMPQPVAQELTVVTYPSPSIVLAEAEGDPDRLTVACTVDNSLIGGRVEISWGDGSPREAAEHGATVNHSFDEAGTYTMVVTALADRTAKARSTVTVPFGDERTLHYTLGSDPEDPDGMTALLEVTAAAPGKSVQCDWDDRHIQDITPGTGPVPHTYQAAGTYFVTVFYTDGSESYTDPGFTVPRAQQGESA